MSTDTITMPEVSPPAVLPEVSPQVGEQIADDILMGAATADRPARVASTGRSFLQSAQARAWTMGGDVD